MSVISALDAALDVPLLDITGEIGSLSASSPPFHRRRPSFVKFFLLYSFSFMLLCSYAMVILLA
jgi:hypothetical protein